jgi:hypothetical protein
MNFYDIDNALQEAIAAGDKAVRLKIEIQIAGHFESVFENDIIEANFYGLREKAGGTSSRAELLIDNPNGIYSYSSVGYGSQVKISFSLGEGLAYFQRFVFYIDEKGIQNVRGPGRKRYIFIGLWDLSYKLRKTDENRDWSSPAVFTYSIVCDKSKPNKSLVHGIAQRAGLAVNDIDCSTIPVTLPYVELTKNIWSELSSLATAYRCHLECATEKPLVFAHSPYQEGNLRPVGSVGVQTNEQLSMSNEQSEENPYLFKGEDIFYLRKIDKAELYRNTVRLKINMPVELEKQEIWRYDDNPVFYDEFLQTHYPFKYPLVRKIEAGRYEARYRVFDEKGKERNVIYADKIDTKEEAENRLDYDGGGFTYSHYDVTSNHDRAILTLQKEDDGDLYIASIYGRPIVLDLNRSFYMKDVDEVAENGTVALNVGGTYFSDDVVGGNCGTLRHYEDWVIRELEERLQHRREFTIKTHRAVFHARVGANVQITANSEQITGIISAFHWRYRRDKAFVAAFKIREQGTGNRE